MRIKFILAFSFCVVAVSAVAAQTPQPTLADASPYVTKMNGGKPVDCTSAKVKINFGSGRGEGYCQAVLADLMKSWENGVDPTKLDQLTPADKMPPAPVAAYELKGDKLGSSMAEYLRHHSDDCVSRFSAPAEIHRSVFLGNTLQNAGNQHINDIQFGCINSNKVTLATQKMDWEVVNFSQQRLYRIYYLFDQSSFDLIRAAFVDKFGPPTTSSESVMTNLMGAQLPRRTLTWKNGVSTIELSEMAGKDLTKSQVTLVLDEIYDAISHRQGTEIVNAVHKDM
jgi:hypothetical protein